MSKKRWAVVIAVIVVASGGIGYGLRSASVSNQLVIF